MTENERLNQKLRDIITRKYKSPAAERKNFFATDLGGERKLAQDYGANVQNNGAKGGSSSQNRVRESTELFPGTDKLFALQNSITESRVNNLINLAKRNNYYSDKYKDTPKTYEGYMKNSQYVSDDERKWLEEQAEKYATAEDYKKEAERAQGEYNYLRKQGETNTEKAMALKAIHKSSDLLENTDKITGLINKAEEAEQRYSEKARLAGVEEKSDYYKEKYKDTPKTYEGYMKYAQYVGEDERKWLEEKAKEFATADDYRKEADKESAELKYLESLKRRSALRAEVTGNSDAYNSSMLDKIENAEAKIKENDDKATQKEYEAKTKDILEGDVRVRSIIEQYYVYKQKAKQSEAGSDEAVRLDKEQNEVIFTPEQEQAIVERFNNLKNEGYDAEALYTYYDRMMQEKAAEENLRKIQQDAINNPVGASVWSVADNLIGTIGDAGKYIGAGITEAVTGEKQWINTKDTAAARVETVRSTVSDMIGADIDNEIAAGVSQFLYQTGMSLVDFAATMPLNFIPGIGTGLQLTALSTQAGASAAREAYDNTGSASNALGTGIVAGITEAFFEKFSIEKLKLFESVAPQTKRDIVKNILKQSFTEASEEGLTTITNAITDSIINGDMSSISLEYKKYIKEGYSKEEAWNKCAASLAKQVALDAAGGAVSGGVLGGGVSTIGYAQGKINQRIDMKKSSEEIGREAMSSEDFDINLLLEQAKSSSNEKAVSIATVIENKMSKNKNYKVDKVDVGNLVKLLSAEQEYGFQEKSNGNAESVEEVLRKADIEEHAKFNFGSAHKNGIGAIDRKGNQVHIIGIESSSRAYGESDNKVRVVAKDGKVYNSESLIFNNPEYNALMNAAKSFDTHGAGTLLQEYGDYVKFKEKQGSVQEYLTAFTELYDAGKVGGSYGRVSAHKYFAKFINAIGPQRAILAVKAGNTDSETQFANEAKLVRVDRRGDVSTNVYVEPDAEGSLNIDEGAREILEMLSAKTGKEIILTDNIDANGMIDREKGKIYIRASLDGNYVLPVAVHECMHAIRKENPTDYKLIRDFVIDYLFATGRNVDNMLDEIKASWGERVTSKDDCVEELVCNSVMAIASDEDAMAKAVDSVQNKSILKKLSEAIKNLAGKIKEFILNHTSNKAAKIFAQDAEALDKLAKMFSDAADKISGATDENGQKNNTGEGVKYSIDKYFEKKYDSWDKKSGGFAIRVGTTSSILQSLGVDNKTIYWDSTKIKKIRIKHPEMTDNIIKQVPNILENPIIVMESNTVKGRLTLFGNVYDSKNNPVLVALELNPNNKGGKNLNVIKIASAYGKDVNLQGFINKSTILYVDSNKERTHNWLTVNRLKLPLPSTKYGFLKNIKSQNTNNVKQNDEKYSVDDTVGDNDDKFATDNVGTFDESIPDIRYIVDDTLNDWLDDVPKGIDYERVVEKNPVVAVANIYKSAAKTAESGLRQSKGVKLDDKEYLKIAYKIMSDYGIKPKLNPGYADELAGQLESFVKKAGAKNTDFAELFENFVDDCKGGILLSGSFDKTMMQEEREYVLDRIKNETLLIKSRDIEQIEEDYGSVAAYRKKLFGKTNVTVKSKESGKGYYIEDIITDVGDMYPYLLDENADGDMGYVWLENLVNNVLKPKYVNRYVDGEESFYETTDTVAIEMAFNCTAQIIAAKTEKLNADKRADKKLIKELEGPRDEVIKQATEIYELKKNKYKQELEEAKKRNTELWKKNSELRGEALEQYRQRVEHARKMFKRYNEENAKNRKARNKNNYLKHENKELKAIIANKYSSIRAEYNESREKTAYLQRLGRMCDRLTKKLDGKAKNNEYIPDSLKRPVLDVLSCFTAEPISKDEKHSDTPGYFGEWKNLREIGERIGELEEQYENLRSKTEIRELKKMPDSFVDINSIQYKEDVHEQLKNLKSMLNGHNIYTLTSVELRAIYETMDLLEQSLKDSVQIIINGKKISYTAAAGEAISEIKANKKPTTEKFIPSIINHSAKSYFTKHLDPVRFGRFLSNYNEDSVIYKVFEELHRGETEAIKIQQMAINKVKEVTLKYSDKIKNFQSEDVKEFNFVEVGTNKRVPVSQGVILAVYLTDRQKSGHIHLLGGTDESYINNFSHYTVLPELKLKNRGQRKTAEEHRLKVRFTADDLKHIEKYVQNNEMLMELANAISGVYNETLKQEINRVSMDKYGMKIATVKDYYPLEVYKDAGRFEKSFEAEFFDNRMKSRGFTKRREWSATPIVIDDVLEKFVKQVKTVSEYCGLLIPVENFKKVYNANCDDTTMHAAVKERYGVEAEHYIDKLIGDSQNRPDNSERTMLDTLQGKYMGAKIYGSFSALLQQPSAYPLANKYFGIKNVARAAVGGRRNVDLDKYAKYTPYLWYRQEGNGTVVGELSRKARLTEKWYERFDLIGKMDNLVVGNLLYAAELSVEQENKLEKGSDAFYREVVRRFEKCIDETQPNNMVTSRPELMRNKILRALSLNAFMSQRIAIGNTVLDAGGEMIARIRDCKKSKTDESIKAKNDAILKFVSTAFCAVSSVMLNGVLKLLATVLIYHRWDDLFDEEGKLSVNNALGNYLDEVLDGIFGSFAFGDKLYEAVRNIFNNGGKFYGFEVMSLEAIEDMATDLSNGKVWDCIKILLDCTGLPAANVERLVRSVIAYGNDIVNGNGRIIADNKGNINTDYMHYYIVEDMKNGNRTRAEHYERLWKEILMNDKGKSEDEAVDYIKNKLVTALSSDDNVEEAGVAKANGELAKYEKYRKEAIDYGFDSKDVQRAIDRFVKGQARIVSEEQDEETRKQKLIENGFNEKGAEYVIGQITYDEEKESISVFEETSGENELVMYSYSDLFNALVSGDTESYSMIEKYMIEKGGKTKKEIQTAMISTSRTDKIWAEYIEAVTGNDKQQTQELVTQLTRIYGSWENAKTALNRYRERIKTK